jgi:hypothetical protein
MVPMQAAHPTVSWADLIQFSSKTAIEFSGGPTRALPCAQRSSCVPLCRARDAIRVPKVRALYAATSPFTSSYPVRQELERRSNGRWRSPDRTHALPTECLGSNPTWS